MANDPVTTTDLTTAATPAAARRSRPQKAAAGRSQPKPVDAPLPPPPDPREQTDVLDRRLAHANRAANSTRTRRSTVATRRAVRSRADMEDQAARLRQDLEDFPTIDVLERRLLDPEGALQFPIELVGQPEPMHLHWFNTEIPGRFWEATRQKGYVPVRVTELREKLDVSDLVESPEGYVTRGERGREILMKMPERYYKAIMLRRAELETARLRNTRANKEDVAERIGRERSSEDADRFMNESDEARFFGEIKSTTERIPLEALDE